MNFRYFQLRIVVIFADRVEPLLWSRSDVDVIKDWPGLNAFLGHLSPDSLPLDRGDVYVFQRHSGSRTPRAWARILLQVTIYRRLRIGRDGHLDQS